MNKENTDLLYAARLYQLRRMSGAKQPELASLLNISQQAYSKLERGETHFTDAIIDVICAYFKISITEFVMLNKNFIISSSAERVEPVPIGTEAYNVESELLKILVEELKQLREERRFYLQHMEKLLLHLKKV
jgi:transcriptional regulator with XRE-family HTH domain